MEVKYFFTIIPLIVAFFAHRKRWLTLDGAISGFLLAVPIVLTGLTETLALLSFFLIGTLATKLSEKLVKQRTDESKKKKLKFSVVSYDVKHEAKTGRNALQVIATAGVPSFLCMLQLFMNIDQSYKTCLTSLYFAYFACDLSDTIASEFGVLSKDLPVLLSTLKKVPRGTDGAISFEGTFASLIGGLIIGMIAIYNPLLSATTSSKLALGLKFGVVGFLGGLLDSILGCFLQEQTYIIRYPDNWKPLNTLVNLISGIMTLGVDLIFQKFLTQSILISSLFLALVLLYLSPLSKPIARKALHLGISCLVIFASQVGFRILISCVAPFICILSLPQLNLDRLWIRFTKYEEGEKKITTPEDVKVRDSGIFMFALTTGFVYYYFESKLAVMILFPLYFADPLAGIVGKLLSDTPVTSSRDENESKTKMKPIVSKTLYGTITFALIQFIGMQTFFTDEVSDVYQSLAISVNIALVELLSGSLDNLFIPVSFIVLADLSSEAQNGYSFTVLVIFTFCALFAHFILFSADSKIVRQGIDAFWRFTRPHTIIGTSLSIAVVMMVTIFHENTKISFEMVNSADDSTMRNFLLSSLFLAIFSSLQANVYIVGLNELYDIEIDIINKPYLPLASGEFTVDFGWAVVLSCGTASLLNGYVYGNLSLFLTILLGNVMGTIYSVDLPFMHWKRFPLLAAALIFMVRGGLVQLGFAEYAKELINSNDEVRYTVPEVISNEYVVFLCIFLTVFGVAIALFKDVPDIAGDREKNIRTFAVRLGPQKVVNIVNFMLAMVYCGAAYFWYQKGDIVGTIGHLVVVGLLGHKLNKTVVKGTEAAASIRASYMSIWKAFYAEYLLVSGMFIYQNN